MARKKVREHDAKRLLQQHIPRLSNLQLNLKSVQVTNDTNFRQLREEQPWLLREKLVVKPDLLFGKRGKNNLVLLDATFEAAHKFLRERLGKDVEIGGVKGPMTHFIIEPFVPHSQEFYMSITSSREYNTVRFSSTGGIEIEENWDRVKSLDIPTGQDIESSNLEAALLSDLAPEQRKKLADFLKACYKVFEDLDFSLLEMNPFTFDVGNNLVPLDMRAELDDTAQFRNARKWGDLEFPQPFGRVITHEEEFIHKLDEKTGASLKLTVLNPKGRIWNMVAGGGASVIFADTVGDLGFAHELGNYGEYSGNPNEEETYHYAKTVLDLATRDPDGRRRALLIGGGIANFTDVAKTFKGIIHAIKEYRERLVEAKMRIFVRRAGPNYLAGLQQMRELGQSLQLPIDVFGPEVHMTAIIPMAVDYIQQIDSKL